MPELATKTDLLAIRADLLAMTQRLNDSLERLNDSLERMTLRLTVRFGIMIVVWVAAGATILKPVRHPAPWLNCLF
jgi:hypothetical protein